MTNRGLTPCVTTKTSNLNMVTFVPLPTFNHRCILVYMKTILRVAYTLIIAAEMFACVSSAQMQNQAWDDMHQTSVLNQQLLTIKSDGCLTTTRMKHSTWTVEQVVEACR